MSLSPKTMFPLMALLGVALVPVVSRAQAQRKDARTEIPALDAKLTTAYNAGHPETMAQAYAADAVVMPPNGPAVRGAKAITDWWNGGWKMGMRNLALTTTDVYVEGNLATETGTYALDMPMTEGGTPMHDSGKYMVLWKRSPTAGWQLFRDIFNSDAPMAQMAEGMEHAQGMKHDMAGEAGMSDSVLIVLNPIKADKRADYEQWVKDFWSAGMRSNDESVKRRFMGAHVFAPSAANPDGTWTYVIAIHPYYSGEDYSIASLTRKLVAPSDTARLNTLLTGARAAPLIVIPGKMMMMEGMAMK
jgi:ketosteroid isomerase-like protein